MQGCASAKRHKPPSDFCVRDFKPGHTWRRTAIGPRHATGVEKQNRAYPFVTWDVRVPVQENVDIIRRMIRRNVLQAEFQFAAHNIENQRPLGIAVAISAHNRDARSDHPQFVENRFRADIAKVSDLISVRGHLLHALRQTIVRVR